MALTKRLLAIALALLLGLGLLAPMASAAGDPNAPIITKQPKKDVYVRAGQDITLEIAAKLPDGVNGTLQYIWSTDMIDSAGEKVQFDNSKAKIVIPTSKDGPKGYWRTETNCMKKFTFWVTVVNTYTDADGNTQEASVRSDMVPVMVYLGVADTFKVSMDEIIEKYDALLLPLALPLPFLSAIVALCNEMLRLTHQAFDALDNLAI
jgi:hypothetical protein